MNPQQQSRIRGPGFGGPQKILMIVGLFAVVIVAVIVLSSLLFSGGSNNRDGLVGVSARQAELSRILGLGLEDTVDQELKQRFQTLSSALISDSQEVSSLISSRTLEVTKIEINSKKDTDVDTAFEEAVKQNDFDPVFEQSVAASATSYLQSLQDALSSAVSDSEKEILNTAIFNVQTVAEQ